MSSISGLPTDSLYKFLAVGGIVLIVSGVLTFGVARDLEFDAYQVLAHNQFQWDEMERDVNAGKAHIEELRDKVILLRHELENPQMLPAEKSLKNQQLSSLLLECNQALSEFKVRFEDSFPLFNELEKSLFDFQTASWYKFCSTGMVIFGALLSALGFKLWYTRVQNPIDRKVRSDIGLPDGEGTT